ncbi:MAG: response regulator, partial [Spirochaetia bacterium]|nr:response regulator [Spirochaetia bacterium]
MATGAIPRVIIVDDDAVMATYLAGLLRQAAIEVKTVTDSSKALEELEAFRPDTAILDIIMPGKDGYEICRSIRQELGS